MSTPSKSAMQLALFDLRRRTRVLARNALNESSGRLLLAGGVVYDDEGRILLIHRATPSLTQWETPGGKVDTGESPEQAAIRELREELGVDAEIIADLGAHDLDTGQTRLRYALFQMRIREGDPRLVESHTFDELRFFALSDLVSLHGELSPNAANFFRLALHDKLRSKPLRKPRGPDPGRSQPDTSALSKGRFTKA